MEKAKEPTRKYVYIQQSHSPSAMEEQVESDMALATNVVNEIVENLSMMDDTRIQQYKHKTITKNLTWLF